jgi:hypothetical protein
LQMGTPPTVRRGRTPPGRVGPHAALAWAVLVGEAFGFRRLQIHLIPPRQAVGAANDDGGLAWTSRSV